MIRGFTERTYRFNQRLRSFEAKFGPLAMELQEGFGAMEKEFKDYRQEFRGFAARTDQNFKVLMDKYGEISEKLTQILETLQRESMETRRELTRAKDTLSELVKKLMAEGKEPAAG